MVEKLLQLTCTQGQFDQLHEAVDTSRESSKLIKVNRLALAALLRDHSKLLQRVPHKEP
jgi:hypothetical protein